jgi:hypothetical protein
VVALVTSTLAAALMTWGIMRYATRRPVGTPITWGEAMVGAAYVFFLSFLAYGVIPHQWLQLAENELSWREDRLVFGPGNLLQPISQGGWFPFDITYRAISDSIAAMLYIVFLGVQIWLWSKWQNRGKAAARTPEIARSTYGRPLIKQG